MKTQLHQILKDNNLDGILVVGPAFHNPAMVYLTGGAHVTNADLIMKRDGKALLFHGPMERDEAAKSGLDLRSYSLYPMAELLKQTGGNRKKALVLRYQKMLAEAGISGGRIGLFGIQDAGSTFELFTGLQEAMPGLVLVGDPDHQVLQRAMATKDEGEIERIRNMGKITTEVVGRTADYLTSKRLKDDVLVFDDGNPVTIGDVKAKINLWLVELGAENPEGTIFAIGRDAGVPHSSGTAGDWMRAGQTIVYDIFPCEAGGGYYYDLTRTWCIGYATDEVLHLYDQVKQVYDTVTSELKLGSPFPYYQRRTCDLFESMGHVTIQSNPAAEEGYVHSLGHGVGLNIHERPASGSQADESDVLLPGSIITIEPGLYYPSRGMGVRLEDTLAVHADGTFEVLAEYPMDLVLKVKGKA